MLYLNYFRTIPVVGRISSWWVLLSHVVHMHDAMTTKICWQMRFLVVNNVVGEILRICKCTSAEWIERGVWEHIAWQIQYLEIVELAKNLDTSPISADCIGWATALANCPMAKTVPVQFHIDRSPAHVYPTNGRATVSVLAMTHVLSRI